MFFLCFLLMRGFTTADSPGLLLVIGAELWGIFPSSYFLFLSSFFFFIPQSFWSASDREETQQTSDYLPAFPGSFHHFSSLAHDSFTLGHFTHSYICSRLRIIFLAFFSSPRLSLRCMLLPISWRASPWRIPKGVGNNQATLTSSPNKEKK